MREILFRAKAINRIKGREYRTSYKNGDWVYGLVTKMYDDRFPNLPATMRNTDGVSNIDVDYKSIGQYTGLTDKDGKKIFEGDILRRAYYPEDDVVIEWFDGNFRFRKANKPKDYGYSAVCCIQNAVSSLKIIGNAYDNPELLEEQ